MTTPALLVTGPPGAGKTTVASALAQSTPHSVHLHADDFFGYVVNGRIDPWLPESHAQNEAVIRAVLSAFVSFWGDGYDVVLDGVGGAVVRRDGTAAAARADAGRLRRAPARSGHDA